ncbi:hypothetical protein BVI2075_960017 [Burkholderia vietnamiensis]|nr:hypothetical protein BVI2075_960017 [Burkholderia vietnamiensis]
MLKVQVTIVDNGRNLSPPARFVST